MSRGTNKHWIGEALRPLGVSDIYVEKVITYPVRWVVVGRSADRTPAKYARCYEAIARESGNLSWEYMIQLLPVS